MEVPGLPTLLSTPLQHDVDDDGDLDLIGTVAGHTVVAAWQGDRYAPAPGPGGPALDRTIWVQAPDQRAPWLIGRRSSALHAFEAPTWTELPRAAAGLPAAGLVWPVDALESPGVDLLQWDPAVGGLGLRAARPGWPPWGEPAALPLVTPGDVHGVLAEDLDGDGLRDLVLLERGAKRPPHHILLRRPGLPTGWAAPRRLPDVWAWQTDDAQALVWDADRDDRPDLLLLNNGELGPRSRLLLNRTPPIGRRLVLQVASAAGTAVRVRAGGVTTELQLDASDRSVSSPRACAASPGPSWPQAHKPGSRRAAST